MKFLSLITAALILLPSSATAYECWSSPSAKEKLDDADIVFTGKVLSISNIGTDYLEVGSPRFNVLFEVKKIWKGLDGKKKKVKLDTETIYEYDFEVWEEYLVYGFKVHENRISMLGCPRVKEVYNAEKDIEILGTPKINLTIAKTDIVPADKPKPAKESDEEIIDIPTLPAVKESAPEPKREVSPPPVPPTVH